MSLPRELSLGTVDGQLELIGEPINQLRRLRTGPVFNSRDQVIEAGSAALQSPGRRGEPLTGKTLEIVAELEPGSADRFGLKVRTGEQEETIIGYDIETSELYVDRTRSGNVDFSAAFPSVQRAPLQLDDDGVVRLHVFVDWSSVEVFAGAGHRIITDRIFPDPDSDGVELFAEGGDAHLRSLRAWPLKSIWGSRAN